MTLGAINLTAGIRYMNHKPISNHSADDAIRELAARIAADSTDATLHNRMGGLLYAKGDLLSAEKAYRQATVLMPSHPAYHNNLGNVLSDLGRLEEGVREYERAIELDEEEYSEAHVNLELARLEKKIINERVEFLTRSIELGVDSSESHAALGCARLLEGKHQDACRHFQKALSTDPDNETAAVNTGFVYSIIPQESLDTDHAGEILRELLLRFPESGRLHIHQGELFERTGDVDEAVLCYLRAVEVDEGLLEGYELIGRTVGQSISGRSAVDKFIRIQRERIGALSDEFELEKCLGRGRLALLEFLRKHPRSQWRAEDADASDFEVVTDAIDALAAWRSGRKPGAPGRDSATLLLARLLKIIKQDDESRAVLNEEAQAQPNNARLTLAAGSARVAAGELEEGIELLLSASFSAPDDATIFHMLRYAFEQLRRYRRSELYFRRAISQNPDDAGAYARMAEAALTVNRLDDAETSARKAIALAPEDSVVHTALGRVLRARNDGKQAAKAFRKALELDPENAAAHRGLTEILLSDRKTIAEGLRLLDNYRAGQSE